MDKFIKEVIGKPYNPKPGKKKVFEGLNDIIDKYKRGLLNVEDIEDIRKNLNKSISSEEESKNKETNTIVRDSIIILDRLIFDNKIKYHTKKILENIVKTDKILTDEEYYNYDDEGNVRSFHYNDLLDKNISMFKKNPSLLELDELNKIKSNLWEIRYITAITNEGKEIPILNNKKLFYALQKIINLANDYNKKLATQGQGLKILMPKQMLSRFPILLAQAHAGNNSQKLKNEVRQLLYSLCRSKKISKTVYNNLIATI